MIGAGPDRHGFMGPYHGGVVLTLNTRDTRAYTAYTCSVLESKDGRFVG